MLTAFLIIIAITFLASLALMIDANSPDE